MNRDQQQKTPRLTKHLWTLACTLTCGLPLTFASSLSLAQETDDPETASWYQVEVVIFTQQGYGGNEQPPRKYSLDFPENVVELLDTDYLDNDSLIEDAEAQDDAAQAYESLTGPRAIPLITVEDPALTFANGLSEQTTQNNDSQSVQIPLLATNSEASITAEQEIEPEPVPEPIYIPEYEKPFIKLDKEFRDLNDSARALDRREKYNVVFHQAWRFAADQNAADPWVLIKAGKQYQDRYEIEGSLRFYKSRFLHFQSDLWLLNFIDQTDLSKAQLVELPPFPVMPEQNPDVEQETLELSLSEENLEDFFISSSKNSETSLSLADQFAEEEPLEKRVKEQPVKEEPEAEETEIDTTLALQPIEYPVSTLWVFDQSKRLEEQQSYYLDHPKMGILVTIKPHKVEITNPLEDADLDAGLDPNLDPE
ncbi:MAG: CsiV family protein [Porticoccaceae bacterium]|nr:CsiV family protein [Porticoccaceae bacterium]